MARAAQAQSMADEVWFLPAGDPWQKKGQLIASQEERAHMVKLAISGVHSWRLEPIEIENKHTTYTVETLEALTYKYPDTSFCFIIGSDQLHKLTTWKYWNSLFDYARIGVVDRDMKGVFKVPEELKHHLMQNRLFRIAMKEINISSTAIRLQLTNLASESKSIRQNAELELEKSLPAPVWHYLQQNTIYSGNSSQ